MIVLKRLKLALIGLVILLSCSSCQNKIETTTSVLPSSFENSLQVLRMDLEVVTSISAQNGNETDAILIMGRDATAIFSIDLSEMQENTYFKNNGCIVILPLPELFVTFDDKNSRKLAGFQRSMFGGTAETGITLFDDAMNDTEEDVKKQILENSYYLDSAKSSAISIIKRYIKMFNPELETSRIEVAFKEEK